LNENRRVVNLTKETSFFSFFKGNIRVLVVGRALWTLGSSIPGPYYTLYMLALGASPVEIGLVSSLAIIGGMTVEPLGGYLADRRGRVRLVGLATFGYAICYVFFAVAPDWRFLAMGQILQQMLFFYSPGLNAIMSDSLPPGTRGRGYAMERTFPLVLGFVSPYIGGLLIAFYGEGDQGVIAAMRQCYWVALALGLAVAFLRLRFLKETLTTDVPAMQLKSLPRLIKDAYAAIFETIKWLPRHFRPVVVLQVIQTTFIAMAAPFWILYATEVLGIRASDWGAAMLFSGLTGMLLILPVGYMVDRFGSRKVILVSMTLAPTAVMLFLRATGFWSLVLTLVILSMSNSMVTPSWASLIADMVKRDRRGRINALIGENGITTSTQRLHGGGILLVVPASLGASMGGYLIEWNIYSPFIILLCALVGCLLFTLRFIHEPKEAEL